MKSTSKNKRLGDFIHQVDIRNKNLEVQTLLGVSNEKYFMPSIANIVGTDLSSYKVVKYNQFAYGTVTSRNGDKISIALLKEKECIVSSSYLVFEINDENELNPDYLMMWFKRPEFDRYSRYMSHGSVRELFGWEKLSDIELPIPDIEEQKKIVEDYKVVEERIAIKEAINNNLSVQIMNIFNNWYNKLITDNEPNGILGDIVKLRGESVSKKNLNKANYYLPIECLPKKSLSILEYLKCDIAESSLTKFYKDDILLGAMRVYFHRVCIAPFDGITRTTCFVLKPIKKIYKSFAIALCNRTETIKFAEASSKGSTMPYAVWEDKLEKMPIYIPNDFEIENFNNMTEPILNILRDYIFEYNNLMKLKETIIQSISKQ